MRVDILTREYPPDIYGGAGVHVTELVRSLRRELEVQVRCWGADRSESDTTAYLIPNEFAAANPAISTMSVALLMAQDSAGADLVHSHTWYANFGGYTAKRLHGVPHIVTAHSLEPLRPWKAEQLGGGYRLSSQIEESAFLDADAVIAVSDGMRRDILRAYPSVDPAKVEVIHNGVDLEDWHRNENPEMLRQLGVDPDSPSIVFVGRITRQKGLPYFLQAVRALPPDVQIVLCAGAPDTPEILAEVTDLISGLRQERSGVVWIDAHLPRPALVTLLSHASAFVCPSIYEPLGIVNLEAMACGAPVVGTSTGGIPEVVEDGVTGYLVPIAQHEDGSGTPVDPERFVRDLADTLNRMLSDPERARVMGEAGRIRAEALFAWDGIAKRTRDLYDRVLVGLG